MIIKELLFHGADRLDRNSSGITALEIFEDQKHLFTDD